MTKRPPIDVASGGSFASGTRRFGAHTCFLCSRPVRSRNATEEHVFPRWLQARFDLWNKSLVLLNNTSIKYRQLTIPCCVTCNNEHLSALESTIASAVTKGAQAVRDLPPLDPYVWAGKILFGVLYKEYLLNRDRKSSRHKPIIPRQLLEALDLHHLYLQAARIPLEVVDAPGSVFVFELQVPSDLKLQFDFRDSLNLTVALRMADVGLMVSFEDAGLIQRLMDPIVEPCRQRKLHPLQFDELVAQMIYNKQRLSRPMRPMTIEGGGKVTVIPHVGGFSMKPYFDDWDQAAYAQILALTVGAPLDLIYHPPRTATWLEDDTGNFFEMDVHDGTWP